MFPNDDLKKDITSWKFVELSDQVAQLLGFENAARIKEICQDCNFSFDDTIRVPIHFDLCQNEEQEKFYQDADSDFLKPVLVLEPTNEYDIMTSLEFLSEEFHMMDLIEIFEILTDFSRD